MTSVALLPEIVPEYANTQEFRTVQNVRRGIVAGVVGNMLEWYDFALFGFFAPQIGAHFFPAHSATASTLAAFGTFAAGFVMRPVGGALFGWIGDRYGRKQALLGSVLAMAFPSFAVALLPDVARIGVLATVLLVLFRLIQGIAVGGEYMASAVFLVEGSQPGRRGWMGSWGPFGASAGTLLGSAAGAIVNLALPPEAVLAWGWRIPFAIGLLVALGGLWIRSNYVEKKPQQEPAKAPLAESFKSHWRTVALLMFLTAGLSIGFYMTFVYSATWLQQVAKVPGSVALGINTAAMGVLLIVSPISGWLSDRYGRRVVLTSASLALAVLAYPLMMLMARGEVWSIALGQGGLALLIGSYGGTLPAAMAELTPWRVRCTVLSIGYNIGVALLGGTTPLVAAWLVSRGGGMAPAVYLACGAAAAWLAALRFPKVVPHPMTREFSRIGIPR
ncbi:MAG TPA: MFS transporter [Gemmatimonadales bacterium]|nr:MFS transporter [Gemmatimonadales bacterium]